MKNGQNITRKPLNVENNDIKMENYDRISGIFEIVEISCNFGQTFDFERGM